MKTITRTIKASPEEVLDAIESFARDKFPKTQVDRSDATVTIRKKVLWQSQETEFSVSGTTLTVTANVVDSIGRAMKTLKAIESLLDDQGWAAMIAATGARTMDNPAVRGQVLDFLYRDERVLAAAQGTRFNKVEYVVATDRRVFFLEREVAGFESGSQSIPVDKVTSVSAKRGLVFADLTVTTSNEEIKIEKLVLGEADAFAQVLRDRLDNGLTDKQPSPQPGGIDQVAKLAELHAAGVLTDEEFAAAKAKALGI